MRILFSTTVILFMVTCEGSVKLGILTGMDGHMDVTVADFKNCDRDLYPTATGTDGK